MTEIFVELNGVKTAVTKSKLFELAASGQIQPQSKLWYGDQETVCRRIQGMTFSSPSVSAPTQKDDGEIASDAQEVFAIKDEPLPAMHAQRVRRPSRDEPDDEDEVRTEQQEKEKKIMLIVTLVSCFLLVLFGLGVTTLMFGTSSKKKPAKEKPAKVQQAPSPPFSPLPQPPLEQTPVETAPATDEEPISMELSCQIPTIKRT